MRAIAPCLWFDDQAEEAKSIYVSVFRRGKIIDLMHHTGAGPGAEGSVFAVSFEFDGQRCIALNGGPQYVFSPAIPLFVTCERQAEVDELRANLSTGGEKLACGWLEDHYGVCWSIVPAALGEMLRDSDPGKASRVMQLLVRMTRLDIAVLRQACQGASRARSP